LEIEDMSEEENIDLLYFREEYLSTV